jgi:hypothetical protein
MSGATATVGCVSVEQRTLGRRGARYRAEYEAARAEAESAVLALRACLRFRAPTADLAAAAKRAQLATARLYTATACILSPP